MDVKSKFVTKYRDVNIRKISSTGELRKKYVVINKMLAMTLRMTITDTLCKKCSYSELFWSVFSRIRTLFTQ